MSSIIFASQAQDDFKAKTIASKLNQERSTQNKGKGKLTGKCIY